jgi:hypothetical protein
MRTKLLGRPSKYSPAITKRIFRSVGLVNATPPSQESPESSDAQ